jgi:hypothetical protein
LNSTDSSTPELAGSCFETITDVRFQNENNNQHDVVSNGTASSLIDFNFPALNLVTQVLLPTADDDDEPVVKALSKLDIVSSIRKELKRPSPVVGLMNRYRHVFISPRYLLVLNVRVCQTFRLSAPLGDRRCWRRRVYHHQRQQTHCHQRSDGQLDLSRAGNCRGRERRSICNDATRSFVTNTPSRLNVCVALFLASHNS